MFLLSIGSGIFTQPGVVGTLVLLGIVLFIGSLLIAARAQVLIKRIKAGQTSALEVSDDDLLAMDTAALTAPLALVAALKFYEFYLALGARPRQTSRPTRVKLTHTD